MFIYYVNKILTVTGDYLSFRHEHRGNVYYDDIIYVAPHILHTTLYPQKGSRGRGISDIPSRRPRSKNAVIELT
jgi:hypothetical protein